MREAALSVAHLLASITMPPSYTVARVGSLTEASHWSVKPHAMAGHSVPPSKLRSSSDPNLAPLPLELMRPHVSEPPELTFTTAVNPFVCRA